MEDQPAIACAGAVAVVGDIQYAGSAAADLDKGSRQNLAGADRPGLVRAWVTPNED
jgi:hypothetical protein